MSVCSSADQFGACMHCRRCGIPTKTCARCGVVRYCSRECQVTAWPTHRPLCVPVAQQEPFRELISAQQTAHSEFLGWCRREVVLLDSVCAVAISLARRHQLTRVEVPEVADANGVLTIVVSPVNIGEETRSITRDFLANADRCPLIVDRPRSVLADDTTEGNILCRVAMFRLTHEEKTIDERHKLLDRLVAQFLAVVRARKRERHILSARFELYTDGRPMMFWADVTK